MSHTQMQGGAQSAQMSSKDLSLIGDQMSQEMIAFQKCSQYQKAFSDSTLQSLAGSLASHHQQNFNSLLGYLEQHK